MFDPVKNEEIVKPQPIGLRPRFIIENIRILEILSAMQRYAAACECIPDEWIKELKDLNKIPS